MARLSAKNIIIIIFLLIVGVIAAFILWVLLFLPLQMVKPLAFQPLSITEGDRETARQKVEAFGNGEKTIALTREETCALLMGALEEELGFEITDMYLQFDGERGGTALFRSKITGIPRTGFFTYIARRSDVEYTTTLVHAEIEVSGGSLSYTVRDFRIGRIRIPPILISRIITGTRSFPGIYLTKLELGEESLLIERR